MNETQQGIITLLKSAITEASLPLPANFSMEAALPLIKSHHIASLTCDGAARCGLPQNTPQMQQLFQTAYKILLVSDRQMRSVNRIYAAFDRQGIDYMPIKGCNMKFLYPKPELRTMGDADILIRLEQYGKIVPIMEELGFRPINESDHELVWQSDALYLELHKHLVPTSNRDLYAYYGDGWQLAKQKKGTRYFMTAEDELIYLFTHFAKHYRGGGIGCRHVTDLWVFLQKNPCLDQGYVKAELQKLRLWTFYENVRHTLQVWFEAGTADEKTDLITDFVFSSGSWGTEESHVLSRTVRNSSHSALGSNGRLVYIVKTLFPDLEVMRRQYPILCKAPWLLPGAWVVRWFAKLLDWGMWKRQKTNLGVVTRDSVKTRQEALRYVGLDFGFEDTD